MGRAEKACGVCLEEVGHHVPKRVETACCGQHLCRICFEKITDRSWQPRCPFCRQSAFQLRVASELEATDEGARAMGRLEGVWDVSVTETCTIGQAELRGVTLSIKDQGASYDSPGDHLTGGLWEDVTCGHTPSGRTFTATQRLRRGPSWTGARARLLGPAQVTGRRATGGAEATFTTTMMLTSPDGETMEIVQEGRMTRKT